MCSSDLLVRKNFSTLYKCFLIKFHLPSLSVFLLKSICTQQPYDHQVVLPKSILCFIHGSSLGFYGLEPFVGIWARHRFFIVRRFTVEGYVEQAILLAACAEFDLKITQAPIIINEAVELAKIYCDDTAFKLINGVLDRL